jgi:hypothetical protein
MQYIYFHVTLVTLVATGKCSLLTIGTETALHSNKRRDVGAIATSPVLCWFEKTCKILDIVHIGQMNRILN